MLQWCKQTW